jgi:hypothetical protein
MVAWADLSEYYSSLKPVTLILKLCIMWGFKIRHITRMNNEVKLKYIIYKYPFSHLQDLSEVRLLKGQRYNKITVIDVTGEKIQKKRRIPHLSITCRFMRQPHSSKYEFIITYQHTSKY